jgi:hypothetical protein
VVHCQHDSVEECQATWALLVHRRELLNNGPLTTQLQQHDPVDEHADGFHLWRGALTMYGLPVAP